MTPTDEGRLIQTLLGLSIFDPSVGSGAFLLTMTYAIRNAVRKLNARAENPTRHVIQNQLHALDISPMAVQITRLRLFIAIMAAERNAASLRPLPNLEGRIVCADTLATFAIPTWHSEITTDLAGTSPELLDALQDRAGVMQAWRNAHTESEKSTVIAQDEAVRQRMMTELATSGNEDHPQLASFARHRLLASDAEPISTDARLLFYRPDWTGFDIVIGNPPYEAIAKDRTAMERDAVKTLLRDSLQYQTISGGDLYNLFCEVSLCLVKPNSGVVTLIVPLSLAFGKSQYDTRQVFERRCKSIWLRHHDVRPGKIFHDSPVANPESRQRVTIITCVNGGGRTRIRTTGTSKWLSSEREQFLSIRKYSDLPETGPGVHINIGMQWGRVPSERIGDMVSCMLEQRAVVDDLLAVGGERLIGLPKTVYEFITVSPVGLMTRQETVLRCNNPDDVAIVLGLLNGHVAYAWWRTWGDAFHVNRFEMTSMPIPDRWLDDAGTLNSARSLAHQLIDAVNPQNVRVNSTGTGGREFENVNFYEACPEIIAQMDDLYLDALGVVG